MPFETLKRILEPSKWWRKKVVGEALSHSLLIAWADRCDEDAAVLVERQEHLVANQHRCFAAHLRKAHKEWVQPKQMYPECPTQAPKT